MDQTAQSPFSRERAVSSEPCSTRPKPFDDDELSARKRRRTSMSGGASPSRSPRAGGVATRSPEGSAEASHDGPQLLSQQPSMIVDDNIAPAAAPQTPDQVPSRPRSPPEPVSSRVTINLRNSQRPLDTIPSSPLSSKGTVEPSTEAPDFVSVKLSVEGSEIDMVNGGVGLGNGTANDIGTGTSESPPTPTSSALDTGSPAVEVIDVEPGDPSDFVASEPRVTLLHDTGTATPLEDPTGAYPFRNVGEHQHDSVERIRTHILTHNSVALNMREWIDSYLDYVKDVNDHAVLVASFQEYRTLWQMLPDLMSHCWYRRSTARERLIRVQIGEMAGSFASLTAHFVDFDLQTFQGFEPDENTHPPDLVSPSFLSVLSSMTQRDDTQLYSGSFHERDEGSALLQRFLMYHQALPTDSMNLLWKLVQRHVGALARFPRLNDNFHSMCSMCVNILQSEIRSMPIDSGSFLLLEASRGRVGLGWEIYKAVSAALAGLLEKSITSLSHEATGATIRCLGDIIGALLQADDPSSQSTREDFRETHPAIAPVFVPDVIATETRLALYMKLITCSQMQLRIMAVNYMCQDMVQLWKRYSDREQDPLHVAVQQHFADFLLQSTLVPYILGPTCHPEITLESGNIIGFLVVTHTYSNEHTDLMWQTVTNTQDQHVSEALLRMTTRIMHLFQYDPAIYFCEKLESLPIENFSPVFRDFTDSVLRLVAQKCNTDRLEATPYRLCLRLIRESSVLGTKSPVAFPDVLDFANLKFKELLKRGPEVAARDALYEDCVHDISRKTPTTLGSITTLHHLLSPPGGEDIKAVVERYPLAQLLVDELQHAIAAGRKADHIPVISGRANFPRKELISLLVYTQPQKLMENGLGRRLWDMMVGAEAACQEDRDASWLILNVDPPPTKPANSFLATCHTEYLPSLPPDCFSHGTLSFLRSGIMPEVSDAMSDVLEDVNHAEYKAIEQVWRIILTTQDHDLGQHAIDTLVLDIYLNSHTIKSFSHNRARKVHLKFVSRCLTQLFSAAERLKTLSSGVDVDGSDGLSGVADPDSMEGVVRVAEVQEQTLLFVRSLGTLREFHHLYSNDAHFAAPDLRSLPLALPNEVEGDSAELKFQSFDGDKQTEVKQLKIGRRNTAASLLASLKEATGVENYRIYYRGQAFLPLERDICKSLEDLRIHDGLILVKRESDAPSAANRIRQGASPVEIEIQSHFEKLWDCLSMSERLGVEVYHFLTRLPVDDRIIKAIRNSSTPASEIFPAGQTFKSLYALHALKQLLGSIRRGPLPLEAHDPGQEGKEAPARTDDVDLTRILALAVAALMRPDIIEEAPCDWRIFVTTEIVAVMLNVIYYEQEPVLPHAMSGPHRPTGVVDTSLPREVVQCLDSAVALRLVGLLTQSMASHFSDPTVSSLSVLLARTLVGCAALTEECWLVFATDSVSHISGLLEELLVRQPHESVRMRTRECLTTLVQQRASLPAASSVAVEHLVWPLVCGMVRPAIALPFQCQEALTLWIDVFMAMRQSSSGVIDAQALLDLTTESLLSYATFEDATQPELMDMAVYKLADMLKLILAGDNGDGNHGLRPRQNLAHAIFWKHFFPKWSDRGSPSAAQNGEGVASNRPATNTLSRLRLINCILGSVGTDLAQAEQLVWDLKSLVPFDGSQEDEPYHLDLPFAFDRTKAIRAPCGYAGLKNLSNTCYLNSLFTQLYMNVPFREFMLGAQVEDQEYSQKLLFNTQIVFGHLQDSMRRFVDPLECVASIRTYEDGVIDIHNQMDVDEFYNLLFDRWEGQMLTTESKKTLRSFYGGQLVQQVRSQECEHVSEMLEPFSAIQCDIKGKSSLQESLQAYVDGEAMGGDNKYKCSTCDRHVDAVKRTCLKVVPDNVICTLKRFDFNLRTLQRSKVNDRFSFPRRIDMRPYTIDHLSDPSAESEPDMFVLVGVLVHMGTAESGHYYSFIRERPSTSQDEKWVEFNDDMVMPWDPVHMESACFGGPDLGRYDANGQVNDKTYSAYMLFYQRESVLAREQEALALSGAGSPRRVAVPPELSSFIQRENTMLLRRHLLFDPSHIALVVSALTRFRELADARCTLPHHPNLAAIDMALGHLDQVAARTKDTPEFGSLLRSLLQWVNECAECSQAMLNHLHERRVPFRMLVQRNNDAHVRAASAELVMAMVRTIRLASPETSPMTASTASSSTMADPGDQTMLAQAELRFLAAQRRMQPQIDLIAELWDSFHLTLRSWHEVFGFMLSYVRLGHEEMGMFLDQDNLKRLLLVITADTNDMASPQFARMAQAVSRRSSNRPPMFDNVIALLDVLLANMRSPRAGWSDMHRGGGGTNVHSRLFAACMDPSQPLELTRSELFMLNRDWPRGGGNVFVDKLISINQHPVATDSIIATMIRISTQTEMKVLSTLLTSITGALASPNVAAFLRAALVFMRTSRSPARLRELFFHVCDQCRNVQNMDGRAFFEFQRDIFDELDLDARPHLIEVSDDDEDDEELAADDDNGADGDCDGDAVDGAKPSVAVPAKRMRKQKQPLVAPDRLFPAHGLANLQRWVPGLLAYYDAPVRSDVVEFLYQKIFMFGPAYQMSDELGGETHALAIDMAARRLAVESLKHLRDNYVQPGNQIANQVVQVFRRVISECARYFNTDRDDLDSLDMEYARLRGAIWTPLQSLAVEDLEDDASEWENSIGSSEQMGSVGDLSLQAVGELADGGLQ